MTLFMGVLFDDISELTKIIRSATDEIQKKYIFVPQRYLHITLVYLGNVLLDKQEYKLEPFKNKKCVFSHLDFIGNSLIYYFNFEDLETNLLMNQLMKEQNGSVQAHITLGKINAEHKKDFIFDTKNDITNRFNGSGFIIEKTELISVDQLGVYRTVESKIISLTENTMIDQTNDTSPIPEPIHLHNLYYIDHDLI